MKNIENLLLLASCALVISCAKELTPNQNTENSNIMAPMTLTAEISENPEAVKTTVDIATGRVEWVSGDRISVFDAPIDSKNNTGIEFTTADKGTTASFTGTFPETNSGQICAMYPFDADATIYNGKITTNLPSIQYAVADGIDKRAAIMVATAPVTDLQQSRLSFKNVTGIVSFVLSAGSADVKSVTLMGNNAEQLSGTPQFDLHNESTLLQVTRNDASSSYVILRNADESALVPGKKYSFSILPAKFTKGLSLVFTFMDGTQKVLKANVKEGRSYEVTRNQISYIGELDAASLTKTYANQYILWESGCDLTFGNKVFNNHSGEFAGRKGKLITEVNQTSVGPIKDNRIYFIEPDAVAELGGSHFSKLLVVGTDPDHRSVLTKPGQAVFDDAAKIAFKNIDYKPTVAAGKSEYNLFSAGGAAATPITSLIFDNCKFEVFANYSFMYASSGNSVSEFVMKDSDCRLHAPTIEKKTSYIYTSPTSSTASFMFENNLFYSENDLKDFKLVNNDALTLSNVVLKKNSLINLYFEREGYVNVYRITSFEVKNNLMYVPNYGKYAVNKKGDSQYWGMLFAYGDPDSNKKHGSTLTDYPAEGSASADFNFHYRLAKDGMKTLKLTFADMKKGSTYYEGIKNPEAFKADPFTSKDFVNGVFVRTEERPAVGALR